MHIIPPLFLVFPFVLLLLLIAIGPIFLEKFWHHHYSKVSVGLGAFVFLYYGFAMDNFTHPLETIGEYISFISLLTILFVASGGIYVFVDIERIIRAERLERSTHKPEVGGSIPLPSTKYQGSFVAPLFFH